MELPAKGPPPKKKKKTGSEVRTVYKYTGAWKFFESLQSSHSIKEIHELLVAGLEFSNLRMVKIEADHPVHGVGSLIARLNKRRPRKLGCSSISRVIYWGDQGDGFYLGPSVDQIAPAGVVPGPEVTEPPTMELVEPRLRRLHFLTDVGT